MFKRFIFILMLLVLSACGDKEPIIGVEMTTEDGMNVEVRLHYFDSKKDAVDFYEKEGIVDYALMTNPDKDAKALFEQIDVEENDGEKTIMFSLNDEGILADDQAFEFIFGELGLGVECNGEECK